MNNEKRDLFVCIYIVINKKMFIRNEQQNILLMWLPYEHIL